MTRTVQVSLGISPICGAKAIDLTQKFKDQLCSLHAKPKGVNLLTVTNSETHSRGVEAVYYADNAYAVKWVREAEAVSPELWQKLAERRKGRSL